MVTALVSLVIVPRMAMTASKELLIFFNYYWNISKLIRIKLTIRFTKIWAF
jgi:hypothetical protein